MGGIIFCIWRVGVIFMKKFIIAVLLSVIFLTGCISPGEVSGDWSYILSNGYEIWHINSLDIVCGKKGEYSLSAVTEDYVLAFFQENEYIGLMCIMSYDEYEKSYGEDKMDIYSELTKNASIAEKKYYLINTITDEMEGPLTEDEFFISYEMKVTGGSMKWINTKPVPENARFE